MVKSINKNFGDNVFKSSFVLTADAGSSIAIRMYVREKELRFLGDDYEGAKGLPKRQHAIGLNLFK
jgi:adenylyl- and sulfurtransferase ThiI